MSVDVSMVCLDGLVDVSMKQVSRILHDVVLSA